MNNIYLIVGESGSGKSTVCDIIEETYGLKQLVSYTTRPRRYDGEKGHLFVDKATFDKLENKVAYTMFDGYEYCATAQQIDECDLYVIDPDGLFKLKELYHGDKNIKVIYISTPLPERYERMKKRILEKNPEAVSVAVESALERIKHDIEKFMEFKTKKFNCVDLIINNNDNSDIKATANRIYTYITDTEIKETLAGGDE